MLTQATSWNLEDAIQLFYVGNEGGAVASSSYFPPEENATPLVDKSSRYNGIVEIYIFELIDL